MRVVPLVIAALAVSAPVAAKEPVWYPPSEPSPFLPDDARWVGSSTSDKLIYVRGVWRIRRPVRRAVLMTAPFQSVELYLDGRLVLTAYDEREALPAWRDVSDRIQPGDRFVAARVYCEWRPLCYAQLRVEYTDGSYEDLTSNAAWSVCAHPEADWPSNPSAGGDWRPVADGGGYYRRQGEGIWGHEFALLPRALLRARMEAHNARLRSAWKHDQRDPGLRLTQAPESPRWAVQFADFCRLDERTGQLRDGAGNVRHLFFTIYGQDSLALPEMDLDQLERDLDLMARADVHLYLRNLGWNWLLTRDGAWAPLNKQPRGTGFPRFARGVDLLDHLVRRAYAHGRYIIFEGDFYWSAHPDVVPPPYRSRYHLYPEVLEAQALATRKIMHRYAACPNVLGIMIGEEDIVLAHDLANPHQHALFTQFLRRKYGSLAGFQRQTPWGYRYREASYAPQTRKPDYWPESRAEEVLAPRFAPRRAPFAGIQNWSDVPLPVWPAFRSPREPDVDLAAFRSYNEFTPEDPLWIDFYEMREDELLFGMLKRWAGIVREAMPHQLLFYSNAQDFTNSWHFLHLYRRADLPFDVIGVGCHDSGYDLADLPAWATVRKAIKVISSYRPYALAPGSPARGIASGEGEGGKPEHPEAIRDYYRGVLFDEIGGGAAWTQTYTWAHLSGRHAGQMPHMTPVLEWMSEFLPAVQGVAFPLRRPVPILVVRTTNLAHSNQSGLDYGNALGVAEALSQLNVEYDIVMDRDLSYGPEPLKVDLAPYRLVILPTVTVDLDEAAKRALESWLSDPKGTGKRVLVLGRVGKRGPRLQPLAGFPAVVRRWLAAGDYARTVPLQGKQDLVLRDGNRRQELAVNFGHVPPTGVLAVGDTFLQTRGGTPIARRVRYRGNQVVACGFPLGFAHEPLWGMEAPQEPRNALAPFYEALVRAAGVSRPVLAPHNLRVYVSEGGKMVLVRERAGLPTEAEVAIRIPNGIRYRGLAVRRTPDGYSRFRVKLAPWEGLWWKAE